MSALITWGRRRCTPTAALLALTLAPLLVAVLHAWRAGWVPIGDHGLIELRAADVLTADHPWLGTWTSASLSAGTDLNNPGPLLFDLLAPFVKLLGGSAGAVIGVAAINGAACAVALFQGRLLAGRRGELLMAAACLSLSWSMGSEMLVDPWQPHVLLLPFLAFLAAAAASAVGHVRSVAWMVGLASLLVQSHLSFTYVVALVGAAALLLCWRSVRLARDAPGGQPPWRRGAVVAGAVALLCWVQPVYEQLFGPGEGNLSRLAGASSSSSDTIGAGLGVRLVAHIVAIPPWFLRPSFQDSIPITPRSEDGLVHVAAWPPLALSFVALAAVLAVALWCVLLLRRAGDRSLAHLLLVVVVAVIGALGTMLVMPLGPLGLAPHQMRWLWPISALLWWSLAAAAARLAPAGWRVSRFRARVAMGAIVVLVIINLPAHLTDGGPATFRQYRPVISSMIDQLEQVQLAEPAQFDTANLRFAEPFSGPVLFVLLDNGQPLTVVDEGFVRQLGEGRRASGEERWIVRVLERDAALDIDPAAQVLAFDDGLDAAQREEIDTLQASGENPQRLEALVALRRSLMVAVVLMPLG